MRKNKSRRGKRAVAHIVTPRTQLAAAKRGEHVTSLCGAVITGDAKDKAPVCQACVVAQLTVDDGKAAEREGVHTRTQRELATMAQRQANAVTQARNDVMLELREAAERRAQANKQPA